MFIYLLETSCCSILFYVVYAIFFKSHTNHNFNRFYLLTSIFLSFLIPWMKIVTSVETIIFEASLTRSIIESTNPEVSSLSLSNLLTTFYLIGVIISLSYFLTKLVKLLRMIKNGEKRIMNNQNVVVVRENIDVCSFLNNIIVSISNQGNLSEFEIEHEKAHISQFHSIDIIIAWLYQSIFWFNPIAYFYKTRLMEVHEFLADKKVIKQIGKTGYQEFILNVVSQKNQPQLAHNFKSIIKTRLIMMNSKSNPSIWSYLAILTVFSFTLFCFSCQSKKIVKRDQFPLPNSKWLSETVIDTFIVMDSETFDELVTIRKTYLQYRLDTIVRFDAETFVETQTVEKVYSNMSKDFLKEKYEHHPKRDSLLNF